MHLRKRSIVAIGLSATLIFIAYQNFTSSPSIPPEVNTAALYEEQLESSEEPAPASKSVQKAAGGKWSDPDTWGGSVPEGKDAVVIPAGKTVILDTKARAAHVMVHGTLRVGNFDSSLTTRWVMVMGKGAKFIVGSEEAPFTKKFTLTLIGTNMNENVHGAGTKFLMAMDGGEIQMHGIPQVSWAKLAKTAMAGDNSIRLNRPVGWKVGDRIVIAPSKRPGNTKDPASVERAETDLVKWTEVRTIAARSKDGLTLRLNQPLEERHVGVRKRYTRGKKSWVLDQRAEVGLLSHNVKIQGDLESENRKFGGHIMIMGPAKGVASGRGNFSSVELTRMGQKPPANPTKGMGRYPMHWHLVQGDGGGQYFKNSSIHHTYNRGITVHGTDNLVISYNVIFDTVGHTIFLEDGGERFNKFHYNLVLLARRPAKGTELLPSDNQDVPKVETPAMFWITNPNNEFIGNVAAATIGTSYWFIFPKKPHGPSANLPYFSEVHPDQEPLGVFRGNTAHSAANGLAVSDTIIPGSERLPPQQIIIWSPPKNAIFDDFTVYTTKTAIYGGGEPRAKGMVFYRNVKSTDSVRDLFLNGLSTVQDSLFVVDSGNSLSGTTGRIFYTLYAANSGRVFDSHMVGYNASRANFLDGIPITSREGHHFRGLTFAPASSRPRIALESCVSGVCDHKLLALVDLDGSLTGIEGSTITSNLPINLISDSVPWINPTSEPSNAYVTPRSYTILKVDTSSPLLWKRSGAGQSEVKFKDDRDLGGKPRRILRIDDNRLDYTYKEMP